MFNNFLKIKNLKLKIEKRWWLQRFKNVGHYFESWYQVYKNGYPAKKMTVIGVTGTDGKTTTATLIYEILKAAGIKVGMITTVNAKYICQAPNNKSQDPKKNQITNSNNPIKFDEIIVDTGLHTTNPSAKELQPLLKKMVSDGVTHVVLEVTAHGIDQHRVAGCNISIGVLTNVTRDHLDDFITIDRYKKAKLKMFTQPSLKYAVLNEEDSSFNNFKFSILNFNSNHKIEIIKYSKIKLKEVSLALEGDYNLYNLGAAFAVAKILNIDELKIKKVVMEFEGVPGRREEVKAGQKFKIYVDFAHTPNALEQVLKSLKNQNSLILVFGCTGERDAGKRPMMGRIAVNCADKVVITSDDTRGESQDQIYAQIASGIPANMMSKVIKENDRRKAIQIALRMAKPGDVVLLAGKGHEKSINLGGKEYEWNDADVAKELIISNK